MVVSISEKNKYDKLRLYVFYEFLFLLFYKYKEIQSIFRNKLKVVIKLKMHIEIKLYM